MALKNRLAVIGLVFSGVLTLFYYYKLAALGFPDGHLTTYTRFCKDILFPAYLGLTTVFLIAFSLSIYKKRKSKLLLIVYSSLCVLFFLLEYYFSGHLENGQGG